MQRVKKNYLLLSVMITVFNAKAENSLSSAYNNEQQAQQAMLSAPIKFTVPGVNYFLEKTYNDPAYSALLADDFSHMIQCLEHGARTKQHAEYAKMIVRLFTNKLKEASWTNAYAFEYLATQLPDLLQPYFAPSVDSAIPAMHDMIYQQLHTTFEEHFAEFKKNPNRFLHNRTQEILDIMHKELLTAPQEVAIELRGSIGHFIDLALNRLVWSPSHHREIWHSVKSISRSLSKLFEKKIIKSTDELDDLYWSLIHRFSFFLDLQGSELPVVFYEKIRDEINNNDILLVGLEELDELIITKKQQLNNAINRGLAQAKKKVSKA